VQIAAMLSPPTTTTTAPICQAVESSCVVIRGLDNAAVVEVVLPIVQRLTQGDWFTARVSACGLFAAAYARLTDAAAKTTLRSLYATLCQDDTPMVRRAAAKNIGVSWQCQHAASRRHHRSTPPLPAPPL